MLSDEVWRQLDAPDSAQGRFVALRLIPESPFNIFAAVDRHSRHRLLLLKVNDSHGIPEDKLPTGRGFIVRHDTTSNDPDGRHCFRFELVVPEFSGIFDVIANDVLRNVLDASDERGAVHSFVNRVAEWQVFLDHLPKGGLSEAAQLGLFAELWFLRAHLLKSIAADRAVAGWVGPGRQTKDFEFKGVAFEVKATSGKQPVRFTISSEVQLDEHGVGRLVLFGLVVERLVEGGIGLNEMVASIRTTLHDHPNAAARFAELLLQAGYLDADSAGYKSRYAIRQEYFFEVKDAFPRILENELRPGVGDVSYSIQLSECARHSLLETDVQEILNALDV